MTIREFVGGPWDGMRRSVTGSKLSVPYQETHRTAEWVSDTEPMPDPLTVPEYSQYLYELGSDGRMHCRGKT